MAKQPGGYVPFDADDYNEKTERVITPITQRNRQRDQVGHAGVKWRRFHGNECISHMICITTRSTLKLWSDHVQYANKNNKTAGAVAVMNPITP